MVPGNTSKKFDNNTMRMFSIPQPQFQAALFVYWSLKLKSNAPRIWWIIQDHGVLTSPINTSTIVGALKKPGILAETLVAIATGNTWDLVML